MKKILALALLMALVTPMFSCRTFRHNVGKGAQQHTVVAEKAQWWILWGIVPISPSPAEDGAKLAQAAGLSDYTIQTGYTIVDVVISLFTGIITIHKNTVTVEK